MSYLERECGLKCCIVDRDVAEMGDETNFLSRANARCRMTLIFASGSRLNSLETSLSRNLQLSSDGKHAGIVVALEGCDVTTQSQFMRSGAFVVSQSDSQLKMKLR